MICNFRPPCPYDPTTAPPDNQFHPTQVSPVASHTSLIALHRTTAYWKLHILPLHFDLMKHLSVSRFGIP
ncbi:hypothetical protein ACFX1Z_007317 [Malus domestica]